MKSLLLIIVSLCGISCSSSLFQAYPGSKLSEDEISIIQFDKKSVHIMVNRQDDENEEVVYSFDNGKSDAKVALLPGRYRIEVTDTGNRLENIEERDFPTCQLNPKLDPGSSYTIIGRKLPLERVSGSLYRYAFIAMIVRGSISSEIAFGDSSSDALDLCRLTPSETKGYYRWSRPLGFVP